VPSRLPLLLVWPMQPISSSYAATALSHSLKLVLSVIAREALWSLSQKSWPPLLTYCFAVRTEEIGFDTRPEVYDTAHKRLG